MLSCCLRPWSELINFAGPAPVPHQHRARQPDLRPRPLHTLPRQAARLRQTGQHRPEPRPQVRLHNTHI